MSRYYNQNERIKEVVQSGTIEQLKVLLQKSKDGLDYQDFVSYMYWRLFDYS